MTQDLTDGVLSAEIELLSEVVAGVVDRGRALSLAEVDSVLGLEPAAARMTERVTAS